MSFKPSLVITIIYLFFLLSQSAPTKRNVDFIARALDQDQPPHMTVMLENVQNEGYYLGIRVGQAENEEFFTIKLDIGSPWIWIPDITCDNCMKSDGVSNYYNCSDNPLTCVQNTVREYNLQYLEGNVTGFKGLDTIIIGDYPNTYEVTNCSMYYATEIPEDFYNIGANGIVGLGLDYDNPNKFLVDLQTAGFIENRVFSTFLTDNFGEIDQSSRIIFGGYETHYMYANQDFTYMPTILDNGWTVGIMTLDIGDTSLVTTSAPKPNIAYLSTVFPDIGVPSGFLNQIIQAFQDLNISCQITDDSPNPMCKGTLEYLDDNILPNITMTYNGSSLVLPADAYTVFLRGDKYLNASDEDYRIVLQFRELDDQEFASDDYTFWVFGASFLRYFYVLYDEENRRVGFTVANHEILPVNEAKGWLYIMVVGISLFLIAGCCIIFVMISRQAKRIKANRLKHEESYAILTDERF